MNALHGLTLQKSADKHKIPEKTWLLKIQLDMFKNDFMYWRNGNISKLYFNEWYGNRIFIFTFICICKSKQKTKPAKASPKPPLVLQKKSTYKDYTKENEQIKKNYKKKNTN